jgi:iron complex transport system substrate-binding protein
MHRLILASLSCCALAATAAAAPPKRIVSLNLCADQYVLALADRNQIAALTRYARDPRMSAAAGAAAGIRMSSGSAEEVLALQPDLVIAAPGHKIGALAALEGEHYRRVELTSAESYADIVAQIRKIAVAVGHPDRGEALIGAMNAALATLPRPAQHGAVAAYYQRRGYLTGTGTLVDDLMHRVGLVNLAGKLGKPVLSQVSIEEMVVAHPDYLIVESDAERVTDQGTELLQHPALGDIKRLSLPQAWTVCGGPAYVLAARSLAAQMAARR